METFWAFERNGDICVARANTADIAMAEVVLCDQFGINPDECLGPFDAGSEDAAMMIAWQWYRGGGSGQLM